MSNHSEKPDELHLDSSPDRLFRDDAWPRSFTFNAEVAAVFDDMVSRSVPLYREVIAAICQLCREFWQDGTRIIDMGCSTGTLIDALARTMEREGRRASLLGVDPSPPMLERAAAKLAGFRSTQDIGLICTDAASCDYSGASVVIMNYTLQFIAAEDRPALLRKIHADMLPGGLLIVSDKVCSTHAPLQLQQVCSYEDWKEQQGYSRTEIERKKAALDRVLVPVDWQQQIRLILDAGFASCDPLIKWNQFMTVAAFKAGPENQDYASEPRH